VRHRGEEPFSPESKGGTSKQYDLRSSLVKVFFSQLANGSQAGSGSEVDLIRLAKRRGVRWP
jgi:hypothetical protein